MPSKFPQPRDKTVAWARGVDRTLHEDRHSSQLVHPQAWPAGPLGGVTGPDASWYVPINQTSFNSANPNTIPWIIAMDRIVHRAVQLSIPWYNDAGTSGQMRLAIINPAAPNSPTSVHNLATASSGIEVFNWLHGLVPYTSGYDIWLQIEAIRTGGSGNVHVGYPRGGGVQSDASGALTTG